MLKIVVGMKTKMWFQQLALRDRSNSANIKTETLSGTRLANLEDVGSLDEAHQREETAIRPAMNGNTTQVHKVKLLSHVLQTLHLVLYLHLTLDSSS